MTATMSNRTDNIVRVAMWLLIVACSLQSVYYLLHLQLAETLLFALSAAQSWCNIVMLNETEL